MLEPQYVFALIAVAAIIAFLIWLERRTPSPAGVDARISDVINGESVQLQKRYDGFLNVRIAGIRTPVGEEDGADWAADALADIVAGKNCRIFPIDEDPDGFLVARIVVDDRDVGELMIERGHAIRSRTLFRGAFRHEDEV